MNPEAWTDGQRILLVMHEYPSGGGYTISIEQAEAMVQQIQSAIRSAKATAPLIQNFMRIITSSKEETANQNGGCRDDGKIRILEGAEAEAHKLILEKEE